MHLGSFQIDETATFTVNTHTTAGAQSDADSAPAYRVYEDETGTPILTGTMALLDDSNTTGFYSEQITLSAANGFERGKSYNIRISAAVGGTTGTTVRTLQIGAAVHLNDSNMQEVAQIVYPWENVYFVRASDGNDSNSGLRPGKARLTVASGAGLCDAYDALIVQAGTYSLGGSDQITVNGWALIGAPGQGTIINGGTTSSTRCVISLAAKGSYVSNLFLDYSGLRATETVNFPIGRHTGDTALSHGVIENVKVRAYSDALYVAMGASETGELAVRGCDFESAIDTGVAQASAANSELVLYVDDTRFKTRGLNEEEQRWGLKTSGSGLRAILDRVQFIEYDDNDSVPIHLETGASSEVYVINCAFRSLNSDATHISNSGTTIIGGSDYDPSKVSGTVTEINGRHIGAIFNASANWGA